MTETGQQKTNRRVWTVMAGAALGFACWLWVVVADPAEAPADTSAPASGTVYRGLNTPCALLDDSFAERNYGDGSAKDTYISGSDDDRSRCEWTGDGVTVEVDADREDYPEGEEVDSAASEFTSTRWLEDEGDPADGLPDDLAATGDEAYVVYDPKANKKDDEDVQVHARSGNVVLTVSVSNTAKRQIGRDAMIEQAKQFALSAFGELPRS